MKPDKHPEASAYRQLALEVAPEQNQELGVGVVDTTGPTHVVAIAILPVVARGRAGGALLGAHGHALVALGPALGDAPAHLLVASPLADHRRPGRRAQDTCPELCPCEKIAHWSLPYFCLFGLQCSQSLTGPQPVPNPDGRGCQVLVWKASAYWRSGPTKSDHSVFCWSRV